MPLPVRIVRLGPFGSVECFVGPRVTKAVPRISREIMEGHQVAIGKGPFGAYLHAKLFRLCPYGAPVADVGLCDMQILSVVGDAQKV